MKESSKRIHAKINVLRHLKEDSTLYDSEGIKLAGDYWFDIKVEVNKRCQGDFFRTIESGGTVKQEGGISVFSKEQICSFLAECEDELEVLENETYDRDLTRKAKEINIHYTKRAYTISLIALFISILTASGVTKFLTDWLQCKFASIFCS